MKVILNPFKSLLMNNKKNKSLRRKFLKIVNKNKITMLTKILGIVVNRYPII